MRVHQPKRRHPRPKVKPPGSLQTELTAEQEREILRQKKAGRPGHRTDVRSGTAAKIM